MITMWTAFFLVVVPFCYGMNFTSAPTPKAYCSSVANVCSDIVADIQQCSSEFLAKSHTAQFRSCACQQSIISAASVCAFDGTVTCLRTPAALTNIVLWQDCPVRLFCYRRTATY